MRLIRQRMEGMLRGGGGGRREKGFNIFEVEGERMIRGKNKDERTEEKDSVREKMKKKRKASRNIKKSGELGK